MSPKVRKQFKSKKSNKFRLKKNSSPFPSRNVADQTKSSSQFEELSIGLKIPTNLGEYQIISEIAVGRCCEVYIGESLSLQSQDAIKVFIRKQHYKGALLRELKFLNKLTPHSHIVTPKGYVQHEERDILIHELLSGTVKDILALHDGRTPSVWLVTTFAKHLMKGLAHLHENGIVHGDIKPHNIMWSGQEETFKLIDFGVSFSINENMEHAVQSRAYQAPETIEWNQWVQMMGRNERPASPSPPKPGPKIDVWSAGCIVAEFLCGKKLFMFGWNGDNVEESLRSSQQNVKDKSTEFLSNIFHWLRRCLEENREKRCRAVESEMAPFLLNGVHEAPTIFDLLILPTTVVRVMNLVRTDMEQNLADDLVEIVVSKAASLKAPREYILDRESGSLFLSFENVQSSETVFNFLKNSTIRGFTLVVSFFPRRHFERRNFF